MLAQKKYSTLVVTFRLDLRLGRHDEVPVTSLPLNTSPTSRINQVLLTSSLDPLSHSSPIIVAQKIFVAYLNLYAFREQVSNWLEDTTSRCDRRLLAALTSSLDCFGRLQHSSRRIHGQYTAILFLQSCPDQRG